MTGEIITKEKHPEIYEWLSENISIRLSSVRSNNNIHRFDHNYSHLFTLENGKINADCNVELNLSITQIKYPFGVVNGCFDCFDCTNLKSFIGSPEKVTESFRSLNSPEITSLVGSPKEIGWNFEINDLFCFKSLKGFPKKTFNCISLINNNFSNHPSNGKRYDIYVDMWFELLESVSVDEKIEYFNNYKDKVDYFYEMPILPKEFTNYYKIINLLKE